MAGEGGLDLGGLVGSISGTIGRIVGGGYWGGGIAAPLPPEVFTPPPPPPSLPAGIEAIPRAPSLATALPSRFEPPVLYATQPGVPPGTGSGVGGLPRPQPPTPVENLIALAQYIAQWLQQRAYIRALRRYRPPSYTFNLGGFDPMYLMQPTSPGAYPSGGAGLDWVSGLGGLAQGVAGIISAIRGPQAMPGGMSFLPTAAGAITRGVGGILTGAGIGAGISQLLYGGGGGCPTEPFTSGSSNGVRASIFVVPHPVTGRATWFRPAGRPILWSSDLSACRRVRKVAGRARRRLGGR